MDDLTPSVHPLAPPDEDAFMRGRLERRHDLLDGVRFFLDGRPLEHGDEIDVQTLGGWERAVVDRPDERGATSLLVGFGSWRSHPALEGMVARRPPPEGATRGGG